MAADIVTCAQCGTPFQRSAGRGRPALRCEACRATGPAPKTGLKPVVIVTPASRASLASMATVVKNDPNEQAPRPEFEWDEDHDVIVTDGPAPIVDTGHTISDFPKGSRVKLPGLSSTFKVKGEGSDGSVLCWGGDTNPNGVQGWRSFMPNRLMVDKRKHAKLSA